MKKIASLFLLVPTLTMANTIWEMDNQIGEGLRKIRSAWSGSSKLGGIAKSYDKEECKDILEDHIDGHISGEFYSFTYFLKPFSKEYISGKIHTDSTKAKHKQYIGIGKNYYGHPNAFSPEHAVHLESGCNKYMKFIDEGLHQSLVRYPVFEDRKRAREVKLQTKLCRITNASIDELSYNIYFCEGDNDSYSVY